MRRRYDPIYRDKLEELAMLVQTNQAPVKISGTDWILGYSSLFSRRIVDAAFTRFVAFDTTAA